MGKNRNTNTASGLVCRIAAADWAQNYREEQLDPADLGRLTRNPALARRLDWQVSRALKQTASGFCLSLSHSNGHAALLAGHTQGTSAGVDIEYLRLRDFNRLAKWVFSPEECLWWQQSPDPQIDFYRLWTIKEALLKAGRLNFPADMKKVGLDCSPQNPKKIRTAQPGQTWYGQTVKINNCIASCVWQQEPTLHWQPLGQLQTCEIQMI
ncbi:MULTISPECIES: 4'-phosphopantetheinyl transferase superfamily protein [Neisseria]|uniref:4'-phosphopantetheinyl transferase superfamily protein n=1 Tax=Neisseria musculi TaxID=1815583 RepID=A0A7H1MCH3_9NEIS|nr:MULTISPECIES: 4'-phosphopantetheinyl transferase superfamily protein [Neisseria]MBF0804409.1 4'-phosphopantetheinyl transferase superfamily protein [Neisseria sp. 19428wB4_WF04]QNT59338.1 4'-phosphopantetheinyl transferase superfamily protein [Neisseria musculi]TFU42837.1 4-phosphopantetheinyl transferase family protein [Neisseria sp. WF04]